MKAINNDSNNSDNDNNNDDEDGENGSWLNNKKKKKSNKSSYYRAGSIQAATVELGRVPYGESSRKYRRTVYTHDDWIKHRSPDRTFTNIKSVFFSGIVRQLSKEILLMSIVATFCVVWNEVVITNADVFSLSSLPHLSLPLLPFQLSAPSLGLLLVFKTNASYQRWLEARLRFGIIISQSKNIIRMASTFVDITATSNDNKNDSSRQALEDLALSTWMLSRTIVSFAYSY